ncbi:sulfite exporter TauE/SafE family protein [Bradyrhizobium sp.]|uniref:sulfite exporter TauE/SafE family protein n=1 Tax=Bradyrhizobium sp. TaxID=376 RepID=UPI003C37F05F
MLTEPAALEILKALAAIAIMATGCAFQAAVGIGLALFVVPLLALLDPAYIPGPMLLAGSVLAAATAWRERGAIDARGLRLSLLGLALGTVAGAFALKLASGPALPKLFGVLILLAVMVSFFNRAVRPTTAGLALAGGASGIMGTMVGIHGPAIALAFQNAEPAAARAMLGAFFAVAYVGSVIALVLLGLFGWPELMRAAALLPGVPIGFLAARHIAPFIDRNTLRWTVLAISAVSAVLLLSR